VVERLKEKKKRVEEEEDRERAEGAGEGVSNPSDQSTDDGEGD